MVGNSNNIFEQPIKIYTPSVGPLIRNKAITPECFILLITLPFSLFSFLQVIDDGNFMFGNKAPPINQHLIVT